MAIRDTLRTNAAHHLQPGEVIHAVIPAQTTSQWFALISYWIIIFKNAYRVIVATNQRILVCKSGRFRITPVLEITRQLPRTTPIGPPHGLWYRCDSLGERLYIAKRFHKDVTDADQLAGAGSTTGPGWYPDPQVAGQQRYWDGAQWTESTAAM